MPRPSSGEWPPWPGSRTKSATRIPASPVTAMTYQPGGALQSSSSGTHSQTTCVTSWMRVWKSTAANATGKPSSAA